jgi:TRAP-type C4-dicarboxylate transport system permease small subunit
MQTQGVWLGPLRQPIRLAAALTLGAALVLGAVLAAGSFLTEGGASMSDMLRPGDRTLVRVELWLLGLATLFGAIYLSDTASAIESPPTGPLDCVSLVLSRVAMILVAVVVVVMFYEVVARYVFERPTLWANEMSLWFAGFIYLLAGLYAMQQRSHIRIYTIYDMMPRWMQKASDVLGVLLLWAFAAALVWGTYNESLDKLVRWETFGTAWDPPLPATIKPAVLLVIVIVALQALSNLIIDWNKAPEHHSADEVDEHEIETLRRTLGEK